MLVTDASFARSPAPNLTIELNFFRLCADAGALAGERRDRQFPRVDLGPVQRCRWRDQMTVSADNIILIADVHAKAGYESEVRKALEVAVQNTRSKDGCILFRLQEDIAAPGHLVLYEVWRDVAALDAHHASAQFKALLEVAKPISDSAELYRLRAVARNPSVHTRRKPHA
jgi:quinol monooxygenase YgiN